MGSSPEQVYLNRILVYYINTIHETLEAFDGAPTSDLQKVNWSQVVQIGEQLSKEATMVGMLWTGEKSGVEPLEENMASFFNSLQGLLLLAHGTTVGAGPTLTSCIQTSLKQVVDFSLNLMKESVCSYDSTDGRHRISIPQLVGKVWESCDALKKIPSTNITAIGRALKLVTVSIKDVLREMKELKEASSDNHEVHDEVKDMDSGESGVKFDADDEVKDMESGESDDEFDADDLGNDLSHEEMKIAQSTFVVVSEILDLMNELIRSIVGLLKLERQGALVNSVDSQENLLKLCQHIASQLEELGACLYPPQEIPVMKGILGKISDDITDILLDLKQIGGCSQDFVEAYNNLKRSMRRLGSELGYSNAVDLVLGVENLGI